MSRRLATALLGLALAVPLAAGAGSIEELSAAHLEAALDGGLRPADLHHLFLAFSWRDDLADHRWVDGAVDRLSATRVTDPLMASELRWLRARLAVEEGHPAAALELFRTDGGLERWWAAGPATLEELQDMESLESVPLDELSWRAAPGVDPLGWVAVSGLGWPGERQLMWLATTVTSDGDRPVALHVGAAQAARLWVNGELCVATPNPLRRGTDQTTCGAWLRDGDNLVVAAVGTERGPWWLRVRLTAPDGSPLTGVRETDRRPAAVEPLSRPAPGVRDLGREIVAALEEGRPGAAMARAVYLLFHRSEPEGSGAVTAACRAAREDAPAEARLLEALETDEPGARRQLLAAALEHDPGLLPARLALADWDHSRDLDVPAHAILEPVLSEPAAMARDLDLAADLWGATVIPRLEELGRRHPASVTVQSTLASRLMDASRWSAAREALGRLAALVPGDPATVGLRERLASACSDQEILRDIWERELAADPNLPDVRIRLARLLLAAGEADGAAAVLREGLDRAPGHVDLLHELARLAHAEGRDDEASELVAAILEIRPQDRRAQRLSNLLGVTGDDMGWVRPPGALREMASGVERTGRARLLLEHHEVRFLPGHLTEERVQRVVLVGDPEAARAFRTMSVPHVPERQNLRVLAARVLRAGGGETAAVQRDTPRLADPSINMFYDTRLRTFRFPELDEGDLVELTYILSETAESNETGAYAGGLVVIPDGAPVELAEIELSGPPGLLPAWELANVEGEPERTVDSDGTVHLRWRWEDLPEAPPDLPPSPPLLVTPHLAYSNHPDWGDLADWYQRHVAPRLMVSSEVRERALRLVEGLEGRRERIRAIYNFVTQDIRYVALEFGEHRYRPFSADWVLRHRMGDCKDKAGLMVALLSVVDIPARMVLLRTADQGPVAVRLGLLEDFNHAIAYLPEDDLYLDGTASGHDADLPPGADQGAWALVIDGPDSEPLTTPRPGSGVSRRVIRITAGEGGRATVLVSMEATGDAADALRGTFRGSGDRQRFARWLQGLFPGADLVGDPVTRLRPGHDPAHLELEGTVARSALEAAPALHVYPGSVRLVAALAPSSTRTTPLLVPQRPVREWTVRVDLGRPPREHPEPVNLEGPHGSLRVEVIPQPTGYEIRGRMELRPGLLEPGQVPGLHRFLVGVERALERKLEAP